MSGRAEDCPPAGPAGTVPIRRPLPLSRGDTAQRRTALGGMALSICALAVTAAVAACAAAAGPGPRSAGTRWPAGIRSGDFAASALPAGRRTARRGRHHRGGRGRVGAGDGHHRARRAHHDDGRGRPGALAAQLRDDAPAARPGPPRPAARVTLDGQPDYLIGLPGGRAAWISRATFLPVTSVSPGARISYQWSAPENWPAPRRWPVIPIRFTRTGCGPACPGPSW